MFLRRRGNFDRSICICFLFSFLDDVRVIDDIRFNFVEFLFFKYFIGFGKLSLNIFLGFLCWVFIL